MVKEKAEASLETSQENLRIVSDERDKAVSSNQQLSDELNMVHGRINDLTTNNKALVQEIETISSKHQALFNLQQ